MVTNGSMTHYTQKYNSETRVNEWVRHNYEAVMFQGGEGARLNKGYEDANDVKIRIPYNQNEVSIDNFKIGDIVVRGTLDLDITKQSDLKEDYKTYNITSIADNNYGGERIRHIHIEGK